MPPGERGVRIAAVASASRRAASSFGACQFAMEPRFGDGPVAANSALAPSKDSRHLVSGESIKKAEFDNPAKPRVESVQAIKRLMERLKVRDGVAGRVHVV